MSVGSSDRTDAVAGPEVSRKDHRRGEGKAMAGAVFRDPVGFDAEAVALQSEIARALVNAPSLPIDLPAFDLTLLAVAADRSAIDLVLGKSSPIVKLRLTPAADGRSGAARSAAIDVRTVPVHPSATRFEVTKSGWRAEIGLENETSTSWRLVESPTTGFGVMLFPTDEVSEVESRSSGGDLPGLREAQSFEPPLPPSLGPGESWHGAIAARGPLAAGLYARIVFGLLSASDDVPEGLPAQFSWITDHAYKLKDAKPG